MVNKSAYEIASLVKSGAVKAVDVAKEFLEYAKKADEKVGVFVSLDEDKILSYAKEIDSKRDRGEELGDLAGVPFIIKDNIMVEGEEMTCSSNFLKGYRAIYDATVVKKIKAADGLVFGKANMDELAMGSSTEHSAFFQSKNPWDLSRVPGGSSGGSAAGVASLCSPLSLGSDTGGSIRQPAAFCGIVGLKPTYGRVSRNGIVSFASSLDQIGPFARDIRDTALAMNVISGFDTKDSTSAKVGDSNHLLSLDRDIKGMKIGVLKDHLLEGIDQSIADGLEKAINIFEKLGVEIKEVSMSAISHSIEAYYIIAPAEVSSNLSRFDGIKYGIKVENPEDLNDLYVKARTQGFGDEVKRRIIIGNYALSAGHYDSYYKKAYQVRRVVKNQFDKAFEEVDAVLMPTTPTTAFKFGENTDDPLKMYLADIFTTSANLAGLPAISFPVGLEKGLPVGVQLLSKHFYESTLISLVSAFEKERGDLPFRRFDV